MSRAQTEPSVGLQRAGHGGRNDRPAAPPKKAGAVVTGKGAAPAREETKVVGRPLVGMKEITQYARRSETTILRWIRDLGFPAEKIGGGKGLWESNTASIDRWKMGQVEGC